jgi:hypothetical protein
MVPAYLSSPATECRLVGAPLAGGQTREHARLLRAVGVYELVVVRAAQLTHTLN